MRQSVILPDKYERLFLFEAEKAGLIKGVPCYADDLHDPLELHEANEAYNEMLSTMTSEKQKILHMALLFDEIILDKAVMTYDYTGLVNTGSFKVIDFEEFYRYDPIHEDGHNEFAQYLKPALMPTIIKMLKPYFPLMPGGVDFCEFASALYDFVLNRKRLTSEYELMIEMNKIPFDSRQEDHYHKVKLMGAPEALVERRFYTDISYIVSTAYESLCWQLMISSDNNSAIMNCTYQLASIGCESFGGNIESSINAYQVLRVECAKMINTFPAVENLRDVITLKETRRNDINNLRQELSRLEQELRSGGTEKAIEKAARDIGKASKALSIGNSISKINKWTNYLLIPIGLATLFTGAVPIVITGGLITAIGRSSLLANDVIARKNKWFEVIV